MRTIPRIAVLDRSRCQPKKCSFECRKFCPAVRLGEEAVVIEEDGEPYISEQLCTGCGICVHKCPFGAVHIINLPERLEGRCIHRYGPNGFALYELPIPMGGKVTGLVGQNGIGKTTALRILAGDLRPNLGEDEPASEEDLNEFFKGSELQAHFSKMGGSKISYKPQSIVRLPSAAEGGVKELLEGIDERGEAERLVQNLDLEEAMGREMDELSGGELQRVGIVAASIKESDLYYFDEPSSHLDVYQRINVAEVIRTLADEGKAVLIAEHDLAVLDYMCDYVHVVYGEPNAYGVISEPRSVRAGINVFLDGFLREENVRFRRKPIHFEPRAPPEARKAGAPMFEYPDLTKRFKGFKLESRGGEILEGEIMGIVGPNAVGKTTFVRMLAGELSPTSGKLDQKLSMSYKPQYLRIGRNELVGSYLTERLSESAHDLSLGVIDSLGVGEILESKMSELSGGEQQSVAIAACMGRDADVYLLDEPSAYLDVEQRLNVARTLKRLVRDRKAAAFVVDHDILMIDYLAERLLVFFGSPGRSGRVHSPLSMREGMNFFLREVGITFRRDPQTGRPRANKRGSKLDREQKEKGRYYYLG